VIGQPNPWVGVGIPAAPTTRPACLLAIFLAISHGNLSSIQYEAKVAR
jgi:hypothetical protein